MNDTTNDTTSAAPSLLPCPFCGAGETHIHVNKGVWNGHSYGDPVSVEVRHWCPTTDGQLSRMLVAAGRDEASAIAAWNRRAPQLALDCHHRPPCDECAAYDAQGGK